LLFGKLRTALPRSCDFVPVNKKNIGTKWRGHEFVRIVTGD